MEGTVQLAWEWYFNTVIAVVEEEDVYLELLMWEIQDLLR
jgi:hypothetical protein